MTAGEVFSKIGNWVTTHPGTVLILFLVVLAIVVISTWVGTNWPAIKALGGTLVLGAQISLFAVIAAVLIGITATTIAVVYKLYKWAQTKSDAAKTKANNDAKSESDSAKTLAESDFEVVANDPTSTPDQISAAQAVLDQARAVADANLATAQANAQAAYDAGMAHMADLLGVNGSGRLAIEQAAQNAQGGGSATDLVFTMTDGTQTTLSIEDISDGIEDDDEYFDVLEDDGGGHGSLLDFVFPDDIAMASETE